MKCVLLCRAVDGCEYVIHTASPFPPKNPRNPDEVIKPAVEGTMLVLKTCRDVKTVKRVVLTSSIASIIGIQRYTFLVWMCLNLFLVNILGNLTKTSEYNENDFTDPSQLSLTNDTYIISKSKAEKAAWEFVQGISLGRESVYFSWKLISMKNAFNLRVLWVNFWQRD